ncbi:winged helix-turn-helix transcriptional regulator [Archangium violaceum]
MIGGLWKPLILFHLLGGKLRFMELTQRIPSATQRMLTLQLRELEEDGVLVRHVYLQVPPKVEYELTEFAYRRDRSHVEGEGWSGEAEKGRCRG